ncbi:hypothetical protein [Psychromonas sp.]|uniref:hypothetical protein n=1 Tax=Psychromonas sp. TaxID=1884585 RepID=UPI0039E3C08E
MKKIKTVIVIALSLSASLALAENNDQRKELAYDIKLMSEQPCACNCPEINVEKKEVKRENHKDKLMQNRDKLGIHAR